MSTGSWSTSAFTSYTVNTKCVSDVAEFTTKTYSNAQELYKQRELSPILNPYKVMRECRDCESHPATIPVILALDVTGSMGGASVKVAQKLGDIMSALYDDSDIKDVEFCTMAIGDVGCDTYPVQISQFEADIRIAEQLDLVYFEGHGGGNNYESYSVAWYMGLNHCDLDCWKRGKKGIIITMGDECPNPHLPKDKINKFIGDSLQCDVETEKLYEEVSEKYDVYHISIDDDETCYKYHNDAHNADMKWEKLLGNNFSVCTLDNLADKIISIVKAKAMEQQDGSSLGQPINSDYSGIGTISW